MNALEEARKHKTRIENQLTNELEAFNAVTGLHISEIGIETIDVSNLGDPSPRYTYRV